MRKAFRLYGPCGMKYRWRTMDGIFCSRELSEDIDGGPASARDLLASLMPGRRIVCLNQVHSDRIIRAEDIPDGSFPDADGVVSLDPSIVLCIRTADCVPVLVWSDDTPVIAAVHAGWRGLALGIVGRAVREVFSLGARRVRVALGPSIGPCCYEVGPEVLDALGVAPAVSRKNTPAADLRLAARVQAIRAGAGEVYDVGPCTCCTEHQYFSYRRDGAATGRNLSAIGGGACTLPGLRVR